MANEATKDFNAMLHDCKDMTKFQTITDERSIAKYGGSRMYFAPPIDYDAVMKRVPYGKVLTTEPITAGIFVSIAAWAGEQLTENKTPYWRTLKANGELNENTRAALRCKKAKLEAEGHAVITKGCKNIKYFVKDYEKALYTLE